MKHVLLVGLLMITSTFAFAENDSDEIPTSREVNASAAHSAGEAEAQLAQMLATHKQGLLKIQIMNKKANDLFISIATEEGLKANAAVTASKELINAKCALLNPAGLGGAEASSELSLCREDEMKSLAEALKSNLNQIEELAKSSN